MDWGIIRNCVQKPTEIVTDYHLRLSKTFRIDSGLTLPADPQMLTALMNNKKKMIQDSSQTCWHMLDVQRRWRHEVRSKLKIERKKKRSWDTDFKWLSGKPMSSNCSITIAEGDEEDMAEDKDGLQQEMPRGLLQSWPSYDHQIWSI